MIAFRGFNAANPQHLAWLKRKIANADRYERRSRRRASGLTTMRRRPRHLTNRPQPRSPWWDRQVEYKRDAITGKPSLMSRALMWHTMTEHERRVTREMNKTFRGPPV